jgi:hypothetical protein
MKLGYRALAISVAVLTLIAAASSQASEAGRLQQKCIDACSAQAPSCTLQCQSLDCIDACTVPLSACMENCRETYPLQTR